MMPERQCSGCTQQEEWGCRARKLRPTQEDEEERDTWENPAWFPLELDGEETFACPRSSILEDPAYWSTLLKYHSLYLKGFLPQTGAVCDQSNRAVELFRVLDEVGGMVDQQQLDEQTRPKGDPTAARR